jgi:hypothetical protein
VCKITVVLCAVTCLRTVLAAFHFHKMVASSAGRGDSERGGSARRAGCTARADGELDTVQRWSRGPANRFGEGLVGGKGC